MTPRARAARWRALGRKFERGEGMAIITQVMNTPLLDDWVAKRVGWEMTSQLSDRESALLCYFLAASLEADAHA